jgi:hypothetical protein
MTDRFDLPVWIKEGTEVQKLASGFASFWDKAEGWIKTPLNQLDAETCHPKILKMLAYQRDMNLLPNEPESLFRKRVKHAVKNAQDAGSYAGFKAIFERLDVPLLGQIERDPLTDWDVITLWLTDSAITQEPELGQYIIRTYGRTCRRYEFLLVDALPAVNVQSFSSSVERKQDKANAVNEHIFTDSMDGYTIGKIAANWMDRSQEILNVREPWIFDDAVSGMNVTFLSASLERAVDSVRGNE